MLCTCGTKPNKESTRSRTNLPDHLIKWASSSRSQPHLTSKYLSKTLLSRNAEMERTVQWYRNYSGTWNESKNGTRIKQRTTQQKRVSISQETHFDKVILSGFRTSFKRLESQRESHGVQWHDIVHTPVVINSGESVVPFGWTLQIQSLLAPFSFFLYHNPRSEPFSAAFSRFAIRASFIFFRSAESCSLFASSANRLAFFK